MSSQLEVSTRYQTVADANRRVYDSDGFATTYVNTILTAPQDQERLFRILQRAVELLGVGRQPRALDCCGGAGNAALKLQLKVLDHERYIQSGGPCLTGLVRLLRTPTSFQLLLQKPSSDP